MVGAYTSLASRQTVKFLYVLTNNQQRSCVDINMERRFLSYYGITILLKIWISNNLPAWAQYLGYTRNALFPLDLLTIKIMEQDLVQSILKDFKVNDKQLREKPIDQEVFSNQQFFPIDSSLAFYLVLLYHSQKIGYIWNSS